MAPFVKDGLMRILLSLSTILLLAAAPARAQTVYVNDQFEINLRTGETTQHSIIRMLPTGTALEVLSENPETGYTQVRTQDGRIGYVLSRFLSDTPAARDRLARLQVRFDRLSESKKQVDAENAQLRGELTDLTSERDELRTRNAQLADELAAIRRTAADVLNIDAQNAELSARLDVSEATIGDLRQQNATLAARSAQWWFISGGGAVLTGALLGFLLPRIRWRRRSRWGEL